MASPSDVKLRIIAENLARAALQEAKKDVQGVGGAAGTAVVPFDKFVRSFTTGSHSANLMRNALQQLSFHAAEIPGPVGKAGSAILGLGISGGPILIATAALGLFALAWKKADEAATLAADNAVSAGERMRKVFASALQGGNVAEFGERIDLFRKRLGEAREDLRQLETSPLAEQRFRNQVTPQGLTVSVPLNNPVQERADQIATASSKVNQAQALVAQAEKEATDAAEKATAALERQGDVLAATVGIRQRAIDTGEEENNVLLKIAAATAHVQAETMGLDAAHTAALVNANVRLERLRQENQLLEAQRDLLQELAQIQSDINAFMAQPFTAQNLQAIKIPTLQDLLAQEGNRQASITVAGLEKQAGEFAFANFTPEFFDNVQAGVNDALAQTPGFKNGGMIMAAAFVTAVGQAARGGTAGAFGAGGSILTAASQLPQFASMSWMGPAGFALSAVSTLINVFDNSAERRHKEQLAELKKLNQRPILEGKVLQPIIVGASRDVGRTMNEAQRRGDRDAFDRGLGDVA